MLKGPKFNHMSVHYGTDIGQPRRFNIAAKFASTHQSVSPHGKKIVLGNSHKRMKTKPIDNMGIFRG